MSINWLWSEKCGEATIEWDIDNEPKQKQVSLYEGNCFMIFINEWREDDADKYSLWTFWADETHMKRCLGLDKKWDSYGDNMYENGMSRIVGIRINKAKSRNYKKIVSAVAQAFDNIKIEVYTEKEEK